MNRDTHSSETIVHMNREQMIAWLTLEGWSPWKLRPSAGYSGTDNARSVMRGTARITCGSGSCHDPTTWVKGLRQHDAVHAAWEEYTDGDLERAYETARLL